MHSLNQSFIHCCTFCVCCSLLLDESAEIDESGKVDKQEEVKIEAKEKKVKAKAAKAKGTTASYVKVAQYVIRQLSKFFEYQFSRLHDG